MELSSRFVGTDSKPLTVRVDPRLAMNFAASVGDNNPCYFDDDRNGVIAPPMLAVTMTWRLANPTPEFWYTNDFPLDVQRTQVHYVEHLEWHRPMKPGETLTIVGRVACIAPHRAGTLMVIRYEAADAEGHPVFTEYAGAIMRKVRCPDGGAGQDTLPCSPQFSGDGPPQWEQAIPIDSLAAHVYDGCADVHFPIHTSKRFAKSVGLRGTILQGTATLSLALREIVNREAGAQPARLRAAGCRFTGMVEPGTEIRVRLLGKGPAEKGTGLFFEVLNGTGKRAVSDGWATIGD